MKDIIKKSLGEGVCRFVRRFFASFGGILLALAALGAMLGEDNVMFCTQILWIALFAFLVSVAFAVTDVLSAKQLGTVLVQAAHFVLSYVSFLVTFVWGGGAESYLRSNTAFTTRIFMVICMSFLFFGVYALCAVIRFAVHSAGKRTEDKKRAYTPLYGDMTDNDK